VNEKYSTFCRCFYVFVRFLSHFLIINFTLLIFEFTNEIIVINKNNNIVTFNKIINYFHKLFKFCLQQCNGLFCLSNIIKYKQRDNNKSDKYKA